MNDDDMNDLLRVSYKWKMKDTYNEEHWPMCMYLLYAEVETQTKRPMKMPESDEHLRGRDLWRTLISLSRHLWYITRVQRKRFPETGKKVRDLQQQL